MPQNIIRKLPTDIIHYIIPYTYQLQNKALLNDIRIYKETRTQIFEVFHRYWVNRLSNCNYHFLTRDYLLDNEKEALLINIFTYLNIQTNTVFSEKNYNIFRRCLFLKTSEDVDRYFIRLQKKSINTQINIVWGLLLPNERYDIIAPILQQ